MLKRKMLRDLKNNFSQFFTIFLMVCIGIMAYSGINAYMYGMQNCADNYYIDHNLQDLNCIGNNFTSDDINKIKAMDHVNDAERKLQVTAKTKKDQTILLNVIESNEISKFYLFDGQKFNKSTKGTWIDKAYADANDLNVGDKIKITYDNYTFEEKVVGIVNIPDHVYDIKDETQIYPDHKNLGIAYISYIELENYFKQKVADEYNIDVSGLTDFDYKDHLIYNYVMVDVDKKANVDKVKDSIENNIDNSRSIIKIEDTTSYSGYQSEIDEGKSYIGIFSGLFLFIAILSVITTMTRLVKKERVQIGTLKALGFKDHKIYFHYMSYMIFITIVASIIGLILGYYLIGNIFISIMTSFFMVPELHPVMVNANYLCFLIVIIIISLITYLTCRNELKENPAETLRNIKNDNAKVYHAPTTRHMSFETKWNIRDMFRNKLRSITSIFGVMSCSALIICSIGMLNTIDKYLYDQFNVIANYNYKLVLKNNLTDEQLNALYDKYDDDTSQSLLVEIKTKDGIKSNNVFINDTDDKVRFVDDDMNFIDIDNDKGVYVTYKFAKVNGYEIGDTIKWKIEGSKDYHKSKIIGMNKDFQNQNMTITRSYYESLGYTYHPDTLYTDVDLSDIKKIDNVSNFNSTENLENDTELMMSAMKESVSIIILVAIILGAVIVYNLSILAYTEQTYQYATLKVLGFQNRKIKRLFIRQNTLISIISVIISIPIGYLLTSYVYSTAIGEQYDIPVYIDNMTYIYAAVGTFITVMIVSIFLSRKIDKIDMVTSLKNNE